MRIRWASAFTIATLALLVSAAAASQQRFPIFFQGTEKLVLRRLALDPTTSRVDHPADARVAIFQDELPAPGAALDDLQARVDSGLGLLIVMGPHIGPASLRTVTHNAVEQTGVVDVPIGPSMPPPARRSPPPSPMSDRSQICSQLRLAGTRPYASTNGAYSRS